MLFLILILFVGSALVYVSQYNFESVSVNLGFYIFSDIPLFFVMVASLGAGFLLAYLMHLVHFFSSSMAMRGKVKEIAKNKDIVLELTKRVHQLEIENENLKQRSKNEPTDSRAL